jgi:exopolyphosphatase/guanosine-5'-triphosphate,3'-diphosphate pyrophosphatase
MIAAVIDLGTNTFNLAVAKIESAGFTYLHESVLPVKLGEGGIGEGIIMPFAINRAKKVLDQFKKLVEGYETNHTEIYATSAIRGADNGKEITDYAQDIFGVRVKVATGDEEADLIYCGVRESVDFNEGEEILILDIGGGSNELIIADQQRIYWKRSFDLGIARLLDRFYPSDPITDEEISNLKIYLEEELDPLFQALKIFPATHLVGASGAFETFYTMLNNGETGKENSYEIPLVEFFQLYRGLIKSTTEERNGMSGLATMRVDMIVLASLFTIFIIEKTNIKKMTYSGFSLKEGVLTRLVRSVENNDNKSGDSDIKDI